MAMVHVVKVEQVVNVEQVMVMLVLVMEVVVVVVKKDRPGMEVADLCPPHYIPRHHLTIQLGKGRPAARIPLENLDEDTLNIP